MKKTYSRPVHPPMPGKKNTTHAEILKKVEKKEFVRRCIAVDICPTCGYMLKSWGIGKICPECDIVFNIKE
jgi:rubrerythrin